MAGNRKEYEMLFQLNAQLGRGYSTAFTKAQAEFTRLGREIQSLHRVQSDISTYQKQQAAVEATNSKLDNLRRQYELIQKEIGETEGSTAGLEREKLRLGQQISNTTTALERQNQRLGATEEKLKDAGVSAADLTGESQRLAAQMLELERRQEDAARGAQSFGETASEAFGAVQSAIAAAGIGAALHEIYEQTSACADASMAYESVMAGVQRTVGGSVQGIAQLGDGFKDLSTDIPITTGELGKIAESAGQLGIARSYVGEFTEVMAMLGTTTDLTADSAATMLAQFANITGTNNYQRLGSTVADLGDATATTASKVVEMGQGMAAAATQAGMAETDILAISAAVGSLGIESQAGSTAMSTLIQTLHKAVETGKGLDEFASVAGMTAAQFKTAWGQDAVGAMDAFIRGLNDTERNGRSAIVILEDLGITNVRQTKAILGLASAGDLLSGTIRQANDAWEENTALQAKANIMYGTTQSRLVMMDNAYNNLRIAIGDNYTPILREAYGVGTDLLVGMTEFVQENPSLVLAVTTFTGVLGGAVTVMTAYAAVSKVVKALDMAALFTGPAGLAVAAVAGVAGLTAAVVGFVSAMDDGIPTVRELTEAARELETVTRESTAAYEESAGAAEAAASVADTYIGKLEQMGDYTRLSAQEQEQYRNTLALLCQVVPELSGSIDVQTGRIEGGTAALRANAEAWKQNAMAQAYQERLTALYAAQADVLIEAEQNSIALTRARYELEAASQEYNDTLERMNALMGKAYDAGKDLPAEYHDLEASLGDLESRMTTARKEVEVYTQATNEGSEAAEAARAEIDLLAEAASHLTDQTAEQTDALPELQAAITPVRAELEQLAAAYNEAYEAAVESISGQYSLWDEAAEVAATSAGSINSALESQITYWQNYNANLQTLTDHAADIEGLSSLVASFADGSADSVNAIAGMADAIKRGDTESVKEMAANWQLLRAQQDQTSESLAELVSGLPEQVAGLRTAMEDGVEGMSLPDEAQESARSTIQAFIDEAAHMLPAVQRAYVELGQTAANALGLDLYYTSRGHSGDAGDHLAAYASGTSNAPPGWAWVGEEGPELMRMRGGETILPAEVSREYAILQNVYKKEMGVYPIYPDTQEAAAISVEAAPAAAASPAGPVNVEIHIHLEGNATPETVQALEDYVRRGELQEVVAGAMENIRIDAQRGAYV